MKYAVATSFEILLMRMSWLYPGLIILMRCVRIILVRVCSGYERRTTMEIVFDALQNDTTVTMCDGCDMYSDWPGDNCHGTDQ